MPEYAGVFFNLVMILCALALTPRYGITSLAIGVVAGSGLQVLIQLPSLRRYGIRYRLTLRSPTHGPARNGEPRARRIYCHRGCAAERLCARALASTLAEGSISALAYAFRVFLLPVSLVAVPVYTVLLTELSSAHNEGQLATFKKQAEPGSLCSSPLPCRQWRF